MRYQYINRCRFSGRVPYRCHIVLCNVGSTYIDANIILQIVVGTTYSKVFCSLDWRNHSSVIVSDICNKGERQSCELGTSMITRCSDNRHSSVQINNLKSWKTENRRLSGITSAHISTNEWWMGIWWRPKEVKEAHRCFVCKIKLNNQLFVWYSTSLKFYRTQILSPDLSVSEFGSRI